jgi:hypothetical protein
VRLGGIIEVWEGALDGVRVLDDGSGACDKTGTFSLRANDVELERPTADSEASG